MVALGTLLVHQIKDHVEPLIVVHLTLMQCAVLVVVELIPQVWLHIVQQKMLR